MYVNQSYNDFHQRKTKCTFLNIQKHLKFPNVSIYKKPHTSQKARQFPVRFIYKKHDTLCYAIFHEIFEVGIYIQKHDTLRYVTFLYTKTQTLRKNQDNLRYVYIYIYPDTLRYAIFH